MPYTPTYQDALDAVSTPGNNSQGNAVLPAAMQAPSQNPLIQGTLGFGDGFRNTYAGAANLIPGVNIPMPAMGSGTAYNVGNMAGNVAGFLGGGEILDAMRAGAEALPYLGKTAQWLGGNGLSGTEQFLSGLTRRALGNAVYGAANSPNDRGTGAGESAALSTGLDLLPKGATAVVNGLKNFSPTNYAQGIIQSLGGGNSLSDNAQSLARELQNAYQLNLGEGRGLYGSSFNSVSSSPLYNKVVPKDPTIFGASAPTGNLTGAYPNLPPSIFNNYTTKLQEMHNNFLQNPTFQNAHELQSQLGSTSRKLENSSNQDMANLNSIDQLQGARNALKGDINSYLQSQNPEAAATYNAATQHWLNNVVPYTENKKLGDIATGEITNPNPQTIANLFKNPEPEVSKVVGDLPADAINRILYARLGQVTPSSSPKNLLDAYNSLDQSGLSSYITPSLSNQMQSLANRIRMANTAKVAGGALLGGLAGLHFNPESALLGLGLGGAAGLARGVGSKIQESLPNLGNVLSKIHPSNVYPLAQTFALANIPPSIGAPTNGT